MSHSIADPARRKRLLVLGGVMGNTEEEKLKNANVQVENKSQPWERLRVLYRLTPITINP